MISAFDIFKIGIGPSSSHTVGPMNAGKSFIDRLESSGLLTATSHIVVDLYGSLSLTGKGHATDVAIIMGLAGNSPQDVVIDEIPAFIELVTRSGRLPVASGAHIVDFPVAKNIIFHPEMLPRHENGMRITAWKGQEALLSKTYYSVGGGFIVEEEHFGLSHDVETSVPYDFHSAGELLKMCDYNGLSISGLMMHNELALRRQLVSSDNISNDPMNVIDWINMYALAVSEENAVGGRVVTAPTNGACGIIPAVLAYYDKSRRPVNERSIARYFLAAGAIGALYKMNASISGAEVGCQGEIGVACSMAAAGLTELLGGSPAQVCNAAEIAMEHNLGLTCDPVAGQVQIPCIERNAINAVKAVNAARMAMRRTSAPRVSLDKVIETMYETGKDMNDKYRETSRGGLAIKVVCD
ncbi:L-serine ammonia-lyase [Escherichia coli]|nr:L-serine ammonia-lyase [Escherichia coli]EEX4210149.1 L-serine ammonia-lyase [Escherichia coli]EEY2297828.1 L-serine ammonia-lyase [Escherichia coli]EHR3960349.1 L-serine ammonia-lyase [Escherichia coli]